MNEKPTMEQPKNDANWERGPPLSGDAQNGMMVWGNDSAELGIIRLNRCLHIQ